MPENPVPENPMPENPIPENIDERLVRVLLMLATIGLMGMVICAAGWFWASRQPVSPEQLSPQERQALVDELIEVSPGEFATAWFEPRIGYTLRRNTQITAWNDTFKSNALGYRAPAMAKAPGRLRVLFVGDSWTFGMGVRAEETFAHQLELLANTRNAAGKNAAGRPVEVEAWPLALPGYNTLGELNALWFFFDRLQPDVVVLCPTPNDNHSMGAVLPNGSLSRAAILRDEFNEGHPLVYAATWVDSFRFRERWRLAFAQIRQTELRLQELKVPLLLFFVGTWKTAMAHRLVADAGLQAPYVIVPPQLTTREWRNPPPIGHPNAPAHALYGRMVYQGLARLLGWPELEDEPAETKVELHRPAADKSWTEESDRLLAAETQREIPTSFRPGAQASIQCPGPIDAKSGLLGRGTTILVRREVGSSRLEIGVRRIPNLRSLYPLELTVSVPSPSGGTQTVITVPATGPEAQHFTLDLPGDLKAGSALDVVFTASRAISARRQLSPVSLYLESIIPR